MARLFLILLCFPALAFGQVFKCVNEGKTEYQSSPCKSGSVAYIPVRTSSSEGSGGAVTLSRDASGRFSVPGAVNGNAVRFTVDTGATGTVISGAAAARMGVQTCNVAGYSGTANGRAAYCVALVPSLSVASFTFFNVSVFIQPTMTDDALLGMDLLSRLKFTQQSGVITLSRE